MLHAVGQTEFDHAVVMVRDRLDALAPHFERQGFHLSDKAVHNLGSCNRLIVLEGTYVELLGWPPGAPPARKEIADSPFGLEALVFRTYDAEAPASACSLPASPSIRCRNCPVRRCWTAGKSRPVSIPCVSPSSRCPASACISAAT